jgi:t-SNARE complex subunit (syntaxin)
MNEVKKLSDDEVHQLKTIQEKYSQLTANLGQLEIQSTLLEEEKSKIRSQYMTVRQTESEFAQTLNEKYGEGTINLETNEFTPSKSL